MKYVALWLIIVAGLGLLLLLGAGMAVLVSLVVDRPELAWVPGVIIGVILIATLAVAIDWYSDNREAKIDQ